MRSDAFSLSFSRRRQNFRKSASRYVQIAQALLGSRVGDSGVARLESPVVMEEGEAPFRGGGGESDPNAAGAVEARRGSNANASAATPPARPTSRAGAYAGLLAGWAMGGMDDRHAVAGGSVPPKSSAFAIGGYGTDGHAEHGSQRTPGKVGRANTNNKRRKTTHGGSNAKQSNNALPCLFWRQGQCTKGETCGFVHGVSKVLCQNFVARSGCRFGDACAFRHDARVMHKSVDPSNGTALSNEFATHAENCGCPICYPSVYRQSETGEDGEVMLDVDPSAWGDDDDGDVESEVAKTARAARDAILTKCARVTSPELKRVWRQFADAEVRALQRLGPAPAPYRKHAR